MKNNKVELKFSPEAYKRLNHLMHKSNAGSRAETIRQALACFDWFLTKREEGFSVILGEPDDKAFYEMDLKF